MQAGRTAGTWVGALLTTARSRLPAASAQLPWGVGGQNGLLKAVSEKPSLGTLPAGTSAVSL